MTDIITHSKELRQRLAGETNVAFVPTMGALHEGHLSLVRAAKARGDAVVVSIFVNPLQFGPNEDLDRYPRPLERDIDLLKQEGVDMCYTPTAGAMYPKGFKTGVRVAELGDVLCGVMRPGHFDGVATVVAKLFNQVQPHRAYFGEKDYQQLCIIRRMVGDMDMPIEIIGMPTMREADGLAMSSRNQYLSKEERTTASSLYAVLKETAEKIQQGEPVSEALHKAESALLEKGFTHVDYCALCQAETLEFLDAPEPNCRLLVAAHLGKTRLIDNIFVA